MTRVLILSWEYPPLIEGGLARHVRKLSEALVERDVEVHVLTRGGEESPAEERSGGVVDPPHPRAQATDRPRRVRRLGRADELRHARRRGRARRPLQLRPRPRPRLARRQRLRPPRQALRSAAGDDDPRHRVRPPPGLGRQAPADLHPRGRALDHQPLAAGDRLLPLHARADRRHLRRRGGADQRHPQRDRPRRPAGPGPGRAGAAAVRVRRAGREAGAADRPPRLREGLPARAGGDAAADRGGARAPASWSPAPAPTRPSCTARRRSWG